jgi:hypothetical protein
LFGKLASYLEEVSNWRINLRKAIALAVHSHFEMLGYDKQDPNMTREEAFWASINRKEVADGRSTSPEA